MLATPRRRTTPLPPMTAEPSPLIAADDVLPAVSRWRRAGLRVCMVTVVGIEGVGPRPVGAQMAVAENGTYVGYLSGGCLEQAVALEAKAAISDGKNRLVRYGKGSPYFDVKLPCGSGLDLYFDQNLEMALLDRLDELRAARQPLALRTNLATGVSTLGLIIGVRGVPTSNGTTDRSYAFPDSSQSAPIRGLARQMDDRTSSESGRLQLAALAPGAVAEDAVAEASRKSLPTYRTLADVIQSSSRAGDIFTRVVLPPVRLILVGSGPAVGAIARIVALVGFEIEVLSPHSATLAELRAANISVRELTEPSLKCIASPDPFTAVVLAFHEHDWEPPILSEALRSPAFYIGALGNRAVHGARLSALREQGFTAPELDRVSGPIGLIPGAKSRATLGLGVVTEIADRAKALGLVW